MVLKRNNKFFVLFLIIQLIIVVFIVNNDTVTNNDDSSAKQSITHKLLDPLEPFRFPFEKGVNRSSVVVNREDLYHWHGLDTPAKFLSGKQLFNSSYSRVCSKVDPKSVIMVIPSRGTSYQQRLAIRHTWAQKFTHINLTYNYYLLFVANMPSDTKALDVVLVEAKLMGDLIVVNLSEDYNLLTVQVLMGFIWVHNNCQGVKYVLKMDDDTYANLFNLEQYILRTENQKPAKVNGIYCGQCFDDAKVVRPGIRHSSLQSKWIVKPERYGAPKFPPYCVGPAYFLSFSLLPRIIANCPFHCIGLVKPLDSNSTSVNSSSCFWDWEDVFIGSCLATFIDKPFTNFTMQRFLVNHQVRLKDVAVQRSAGAFHPVKSSKKLILIHKLVRQISSSNIEKLQKSFDMSVSQVMILGGVLAPFLSKDVSISDLIGEPFKEQLRSIALV